MAGYLAYIIPVEGSPGRPDNSLPGQPPGVWPSPGHPSHPIELPPGSVSGTPEHPIYTPPGQPSHPIVLPPNSVGGTPEHPIYYPPTVWPPGGHPAHPIAPGGSPGRPDNTLPGGGLGFWGGQAPPLVDNTLPPQPVEPPAGGVDKPPPADGGWGYVSEAGYGWGYFPGVSGAQPK